MLLGSTHVLTAAKPKMYTFDTLLPVPGYGNYPIKFLGLTGMVLVLALLKIRFRSVVVQRRHSVEIEMKMFLGRGSQKKIFKNSF